MVIFDILEAIGFAAWSYWRILTTGHYPTSRTATKGH